MLQSQQGTGKSLHETVAAGRVGYSTQKRRRKTREVVGPHCSEKLRIFSGKGYQGVISTSVTPRWLSPECKDRALQEAQVTGGGTYLGVQVLLWVGTSDGVHRGLVRIRRRRVGRRGVVTLGRWHLVGSPRSVP